MGLISKDEKDKEIRKDVLDEFLFSCSPDRITRRIHDHKMHRDSFEGVSELEKSALTFILDDCKSIYSTKSEEGQKYFKNENLLCLYNAVHGFMETGSREDAFDVYYALINIISVSDYGRAKKLIEMLSNYENSASSLVMSHRDHYSHSVYVFIIGLAIYNNNAKYREVYRNTYYGKSAVADDEAALNFLQFWGVTSLFHDIGYPFEIPFEQIKTYFTYDKPDRVRGEVVKKSPYISYQQMDELFDLEIILGASGADENTCLEQVKNLLENEKIKDIGSLTAADVLACHIYRRMKQRHYPKKYIRDILLTKPAEPESFDYYMDHAVFSGVLIFRKLIEIFGTDTILGRVAENEYDKQQFYGWMDSMTAIVLHNSMFKFSLREIDEKETPLKMEEHPLAYLLMLCDELQCWDRTSYGKESKQQLHAMDCVFGFEDEKITAVYLFETDKNAIEFQNGEIFKVVAGTYKKFMRDKKGSYFQEKDRFIEGNPDTWEIKPGSEEALTCKFYKDIEEILDLTDLTHDGSSGLKVGCKMEPDTKFREDNLSSIRLINIYELAVELYAGTHGIKASGESVFSDFSPVPSLAEQLSYIQVVKNMASYLDSIGMLYTDEPKALTRKRANEFTLTERRYLYALETERERLEKIFMCRGGVTDEFVDYLNEDPARAAAFFRERYMIKDEGEGENQDRNKYKNKKKNKVTEKIINVTEMFLIDNMIDILDENCNIYYLPLKRRLEAYYSPESIKRIGAQIERGEKDISYDPDKILEIDTSGDIIREYPKDRLFFEVAVDDLFSTDEKAEWLDMVHVKDYYFDHPLDHVDEDGDTPVFYYRYEEVPHTRLRLETQTLMYDEDDDYLVCTSLYLEENYDADPKSERKTVKRIDRMMYYLERNADGETVYDHLWLRKAPEGCLEMRSFFSMA
ncbi:MAG: hypothetical protein K6F86_02390 [Lachnospiraceae bacterium]|nr:hypothetical protein [Lachnospiraceae bacterium]